MKNYILILFTALLFSGCSAKIDPNQINPDVFVPNTYNTYNEKESTITTYFFKQKDGKLTATYALTYIPMDATDQLYGAFSSVTLTLNRLTNNQASTLEEALAMEVKKNGAKKLFNDKEEYIIGNDFARDLKFSIKEFEDMIDRQDGKEEIIILPI